MYHMLTPSLRSTDTANKASANSRATFAGEGAIIMTPVSHVRYIVRALLCLCVYFILQLPESYGMKVDKDTFIRAFTMEHDGGRINTGRWLLGPGHSSLSDEEWENIEHDELGEDTERARNASWERWRMYQEKMAKHTPLIAKKGKSRSTEKETGEKSKNKGTNFRHQQTEY